MTLPDVYLIGAPKAGTTSLARWMAEHPDIYFSVPKEPFYWAADSPRLRQHYGFATRESYEALFDSAAAADAKRRVEGSTVYLYSDRAVPDIVAAVDQPRFVLAVRDPVDLLVSWHRTQLVALNEDEPDFLAAWRRSVDGRLPDTDPLDPKFLDYPRIGALGLAVSRLLSVITRQQLHVVSFDALSRDPRAVWSDLTEFLDVAQEPVPTFKKYNASDKMYRFPRLRRFTHRPPAALGGPMAHIRQWSRTTPLPIVARLKDQMWRPAEKPSITPAAKAEVAAHFREDVRLLGRQLSVDVSRWSSEQNVAG